VATVADKLKGTLKIGDQTTGVEVEAQVSEVGMPLTVTRDSPLTVLTGDVIQAQATYSRELSGTMLLDLTAAGGVYYTLRGWQGTEQPFTFLPVGATGPTITGVVIVDGFDWAVQKAGGMLQSGFKWPVQGTPVETPPTATRTGATRG